MPLPSQKKRELRLILHVDDLLVAGDRDDLMWLRETLNGYFENRAEILGDGEGEIGEIKYLNRRIKWAADGISYEHDPAHVKNILSEMGMEKCSLLQRQDPVMRPTVRKES